MPRVPHRASARRMLRLCGQSLAVSVLLCVNGWAADNKKLVQFAPIEQGAVPLGKEEKRYLAFGEVMYNYYRGEKFSALTRLLMNQKQGLFGSDTDYAELLLGDLYVTFGLPEHAEKHFNRLLEKNLLQQTRAETWFHKGILHYKEGRYEKAIDVLDSDKVSGLPQNMMARRNLMLANLYMYKQDYAGALEFLYSIPGNSKEGAYANYNMGVALVRSGHEDQGLQLLRTVVNLPPADTETNALKDRAALAVGLAELQRDNFAPARQALQSVRADGPFSNEALLALGMTNFERGAAKKALPLWLELVRRNPGHQSVQEALMLAPRAYEELGAMPQALAGYQFAADTYRQELKQVERAILDIDRASWLENLKPATPSRSAIPDPMAEIRDYTSSGGPEMTYLYKLFASHDFSRMFQQYLELERLRQLLNKWERDLPALGETLANQKSRFAGNLAPARSSFVEARKQQVRLEADATHLLNGIPATLDMNHPENLASYPELIMLNKVRALENALQGSAQDWADRQYRERLRRIRGLLLWDIAENAAEQRQRQEREATRLVEESRVAGVRIEALERLVREATARLRGDLDKRLTAQYQDISRLRRDIDELINDVRQILKNDALRVLADSRKTLGNRLGEAHLAIARVQDESVSTRSRARDAFDTEDAQNNKGSGQ